MGGKGTQFSAQGSEWAHPGGAERKCLVSSEHVPGATVQAAQPQQEPAVPDDGIPAPL